MGQLGKLRIQKRKAVLGVVAGTTVGLAVVVAKKFGPSPGQKPKAKNVPAPRMMVVDTLRLQRAWKAKGSPPCEHLWTEKEYYRDNPTGYLVCTTCGESIRDTAASTSGAV